MPHPLMFADDDPLLGELRAVVATFPAVAEKVSHGRPWFHCVRSATVSRAFAVYGGSVQNPGSSGRRVGTEKPQGLLFRADPDESPALLEDARFFVPAYLAAAGWLGLDLALAAPDWSEVQELLDASYRQVATKALIRQLD